MRAYIHAMNPRMRKKYMERKKIGWKDVIGLICILTSLILSIYLITK